MLKAMLVTICGATVLVMLIALGGVHSHRAGIETVGVKAASSIIAANKMVAAMQDMDSQAASFLTGRPGANMQAENDYDARRSAVGAALLDASKNVSFGESVEKPIRVLQDGLVRYEVTIAAAKDMHERGDEAFLAAYRAARAIMENELKPAAADLDKANQAIIEQVYGETSASAWRWQLGLIAIGLITLAALAYTQSFISRKMRRSINPALLAATVLSAVGIFYTCFAFHVESSSLQTAKEDAFGSVHTLLAARAVAFDAKGDESRWLLDRPLKDRYEQDFRAKSGQLKAVDADAARAYAAFVEVDQKVRGLENGGQHAKAIALGAGNDPGEANWAFTQFDQAVSRTIEVNQKKFDEAIARGFAATAGYDYVAPGVAFLVILLTFIGLRPRMKEYDI